MKSLNSFLIILSLWTSAWASSSLELLQLHRDYTEALSLKDEKEQTQAITKVRQAYQRHVMATDRPSSSLHYNLGTLHLKLEEYGPAIYHLKLAHQKDPNDTRVVDHLQRAASQASVPIVEKDQTLVGGWAQDTWEAVPVLGLQIFLIAISFIGLVFVIIGPSPRKLSRWFAFTFGVLLVSTITMIRQSEWGISEEVVLMENFNPRSGVGLSYPGILEEGELKSGHSGTLLRRQGDWIEVSWYESGKGWAPASRVSEISKSQ